MAFNDDEELTSDIAKMAQDSMDSAEEKELRKMEKLRQKEEKKRRKEEKKNKKKQSSYDDIDDGNDESPLDKVARAKAEYLGKSFEKQEETANNVEDESASNQEVETSKNDSQNSEVESSSKDEVEVSKKNSSSDEKEAETKPSSIEEEDDYDVDYRPKKKKKSNKKKRKNSSAPDRDKNYNIVKELFNLLIYLGFVVLICFLIVTFVGQRVTVEGRSMESTLHNGDNLWVDKLSYNFSDPKRYDIVVFKYKGNGGDSNYIKRIIGLPGETVQILEDGSITINGKVLNEHYGKEIIKSSNRGIAAQPIKLGMDEYFVMGDNRNNSHDSRASDVGNITKDDMMGKAVFRLSPFKDFGKIK